MDTPEPGQLRSDLRTYWSAVWKHFGVALTGVVALLSGLLIVYVVPPKTRLIGSDLKTSNAPIWPFLVFAGLFFSIAQFRAWRDLRRDVVKKADRIAELERALNDTDERMREVALQQAQIHYQEQKHAEKVAELKQHARLMAGIYIGSRLVEILEPDPTIVNRPTPEQILPQLQAGLETATAWVDENFAPPDAFAALTAGAENIDVSDVDESWRPLIGQARAALANLKALSEMP